MLCYAIFDLYPTHFSLLMQDFGLVVAGAMAVVLLNVFAVWLITTVLSIILLPTYLLGVLRPAIQKIALRLQKGVLKESKAPAPAAARFPDRASAPLFAPS
jgi:membrane protein YdbS with pleckstrin-like domain